MRAGQTFPPSPERLIRLAPGRVPLPLSGTLSGKTMGNAPPGPLLPAVSPRTAVRHTGTRHRLPGRPGGTRDPRVCDRTYFHRLREREEPLVSTVRVQRGPPSFPTSLVAPLWVLCLIPPRPDWRLLLSHFRYCLCELPCGHVQPIGMRLNLPPVTTVQQLCGSGSRNIAL